MKINGLALLQMALMILQAVLSSAQASGVAQEVVDGIKAAVDKLTEVHDSAVTRGQLEELRIQQLF